MPEVNVSSEVCSEETTKAILDSATELAKHCAFVNPNKHDQHCEM